MSTNPESTANHDIETNRRFIEITGGEELASVRRAVTVGFGAQDTSTSLDTDAVEAHEAKPAPKAETSNVLTFTDADGDRLSITHIDGSRGPAFLINVNNRNVVIVWDSQITPIIEFLARRRGKRPTTPPSEGAPE